MRQSADESSEGESTGSGCASSRGTNSDMGSSSSGARDRGGSGSRRDIDGASNSGLRGYSGGREARDAHEEAGGGHSGGSLKTIIAHPLRAEATPVFFPIFGSRSTLANKTEGPATRPGLVAEPVSGTEPQGAAAAV